MNEHSSATAAQPSGTQPAKGSPIRTAVRVVLFGILIYLLCALPYDYFIARPGQAAAWKKIYNEKYEEPDAKEKGEEPGLLQIKNLKSGDVETTNETVAETLGRKPSSTIEHPPEKGYTEEIYSWRGGLPWRTYNIHVVYVERGKKDNRKLRLENAFLNEPPADLTAPADPDAPETPTEGTTSPPPGGLSSPPGPPGGAGGPRPPGPPTTPRPDGEETPDKKDASDEKKTDEKKTDEKVDSKEKDEAEKSDS